MKNRLVILVLFLMLCFASSAEAQSGVPILCYHHVGPYHQIGKLVNKYTVTPHILRTHFDYLKKNGYTAISLEDYIRYNRGEKNLPEKSVLIS